MEKASPCSLQRLFWILLLAVLVGCASPTAQPAPTLPSPNMTDPTATRPTATVPTGTATPTETAVPTETPTETSLPPTTTETRTPTATATSTQTQTPAATAKPGANLPAASSRSVKIYYIQLDTGGSVGCGDSLIPSGSGVDATGDVAKDVAAGLRQLFASKWDYSGQLYNPLFRSNISVQYVEFDDSSGLISVWLSGNYKPSGDDCDNTRVKAQIWSTIRQFRGITKTNIFLNDIPFGDRLSNDK